MSFHTYTGEGVNKLSSENKKKLKLAFSKFEREISSSEKESKKIEETLQIALKEHRAVEHSISIQQINDGQGDISSMIQTIKTSLSEKSSSENNALDNFSSSDGTGYSEKGSILIVLRPTKSKMFENFRRSLQDTTSATSQHRQNDMVSTSTKTSENNNFDVIRAEELLLLALYPPNKDILSAPTEHGEAMVWAEPGCQLRLDVPESPMKQYLNTILPSRPDCEIFRQLHSEYSSTKGRQASALLSRQHYKQIPTCGYNR